VIRRARHPGATVELRFTLNARINADSNISLAVVQIASNEAEAAEAGTEARKMVEAYMAGYSCEEEGS